MKYVWLELLHERQFDEIMYGLSLWKNKVDKAIVIVSKEFLYSNRDDWERLLKKYEGFIVAGLKTSDYEGEIDSLEFWDNLRTWQLEATEKLPFNTPYALDIELSLKPYYTGKTNDWELNLTTMAIGMSKLPAGAMMFPAASYNNSTVHPWHEFLLPVSRLFHKILGAELINLSYATPGYANDGPTQQGVKMREDLLAITPKVTELLWVYNKSNNAGLPYWMNDEGSTIKKLMSMKGVENYIIHPSESNYVDCGKKFASQKGGA